MSQDQNQAESAPRWDGDGNVVYLMVPYSAGGESAFLAGSLLGGVSNFRDGESVLIKALGQRAITVENLLHLHAGLVQRFPSDVVPTEITPRWEQSDDPHVYLIVTYQAGGEFAFGNARNLSEGQELMKIALRERAIREENLPGLRADLPKFFPRG